MEVKSTKRRCDCDADSVVDLLVGGLVATTFGALEAIFQREGFGKGVGWKSVLVQDGGVVALPAYVCEAAKKNGVETLTH